VRGDVRGDAAGRGRDVSGRGESETKTGSSGGASGIMRGMDHPEIKPAPSLPWYRAILTRTPRGRRIRRRVALVLAVVTVPWWLSFLFGDPKYIAWKLGLGPMPSYYVKRCHVASDCAGGRCSHGAPLCAFDLVGPDVQPAGTCWCPPAPPEEIDGGGGREGGP
jgi:hypothetical protein